MADIDNFAEISENFDTVKTLLNSIRAQGILNTSDVDKLLSGINSKLEKINTEEDIDLIKIFLTELKQNLDERHGVLVSKFGAIESLFSNLLKNSSEMLKTSEIKELFDIVATNLSVFSREVVSQKESLTDISLRLDALRTDDSQKRDIIKNIAVLKSDLDRLSNGFDSIVINLNDNFKTLVKTITSIDKTEYLDKFSDSLASIEMSSNTVLSALQMLDKKAESVEEALVNLATRDDIEASNKKMFELTAQSKELVAAITDLSDRYVRIDNLADKIDASVNIIATLKSVLEDSDDKNARVIIEEIKNLEEEVEKISSDTKFEEFKTSLEVVLNGLTENSLILTNNLSISSDDIKKLLSIIEGLDIKTGFKSVLDNLVSSVQDIKTYVAESTNTLTTLQDANITRVLNDITNSSDALNSRLAETQSSLAILCEKHFNSVFETISDLKGVIAQLDENNVSANNAIFSSITDRLTVFETSLRSSLDAQEKTVSYSSAQLVEQIDNIKKLSGVIDYKMDSSVIEIGNVKREFESLKSAVDEVLALDFVQALKDLRVDLYASKQEMVNSFEATNADLSDKITNDLYGKYELLISKLDTLADDFKKAQMASMTDIKTVLENIAASIVDVLSYVSEKDSAQTQDLDVKLASLTNVVKEHNLNYVETVRDVVDVIRIQVENNIKALEEEQAGSFDLIKKSISENSEDLKQEFKYSYNKLLEILDSYSEIKEILNVNSISNTDKFDGIISSTNVLKTDFEAKINTVKASILDKISEFKKELTCENLEKSSELKFTVDSLYAKTSQDVNSLILELKDLINSVSKENLDNRESNIAKILDNFGLLKDYIGVIGDDYAKDLATKVEDLSNDFAKVRVVLEKVDENVDADMTRQLSIIESNFETLVSQMTILSEKSDMTIIDKINQHFESIQEKVNENIVNKLDSYKSKIEQTFDELKLKAVSQSEYLQERIVDLNSVLKASLGEQAEENFKQIEVIAENLKAVIDENIKLTAADYVSLKNKLNEFAKDVEANNEALIVDFKSQFDDITKYIDSVLDIQAREVAVKYDEVMNNLEQATSSVKLSVDDVKNLSTGHIELTNELKNGIAKLLATATKNTESINNIPDLMIEQIGQLKTLSSELAAEELSSIDAYITNLKENVESQKANTIACRDLIIDFLTKELGLISQNIEKETDVIIAEVIEQFDLMKKSSSDEILNLSSRIEEIVADQFYNNIEDLKSYLDVKTNDKDLIAKLDSLKLEIDSFMQEAFANMDKLLDAGVFSSAMSDYRLANEILMNSSIDRINDKIECFISDNMSSITAAISDSTKSIEERFVLFDKKFIDTVVDKYEELKIISNKSNSYYEEIKHSVNDSLVQLSTVKDEILAKVDGILNAVNSSIASTNKEIEALISSFENLKSQISNKSFDEAFQASINKQIDGLENLINEQLNYIEDINELCSVNLPDIAELNSVVKYTILDAIKDFTSKIETLDIQTTLEDELKQFKTDIITQFLNVFNQVSFIAEQEEIIDFIQDKHDDLIEILSHIVTTTEEVVGVKDSIDTLKDDISHINEKINMIISADGDIDYIYSLQDLESDIANLRLVLNEMNAKNNSQEFVDLISSTNEIYELVESVKSELPSKRDFDAIAEDIVSISTRTNKLLLASDESYKTLHENLQDFKLVIDDLDERTRNFSRESGMDKIDSKLNALNNMMLNGAKTNQVFNQVFEYLAEWVDNASVQINTISDKVETLDEISQIKNMIAELKAGSEDNSDSIELIEALSAVFDKQAKKINSLEKKLDKIIVETTVNNKVDMKPMEDTLNKFLVAIDDKMSAQQDKIKSLEVKLESVLNSLDKNDNLQLSKKVGGMDRQIAKLNKSIEKIASHVVEK